MLDGDNVRHGLSSNLSFSENDRKENISRIGEAAKLMTEAGIIALTAFISPFRDDRKMVRNLFPHGEFIEVNCNASLEVCESHDVKGLYKKAKAGEIKSGLKIQMQQCVRFEPFGFSRSFGYRTRVSFRNSKRHAGGYSEVRRCG